MVLQTAVPPRMRRTSETAAWRPVGTVTIQIYPAQVHQPRLGSYGADADAEVETGCGGWMRGARAGSPCDDLQTATAGPERSLMKTGCSPYHPSPPRRIRPSLDLAVSLRRAGVQRDAPSLTSREYSAPGRTRSLLARH